MNFCVVLRVTARVAIGLNLIPRGSPYGEGEAYSYHCRKRVGVLSVTAKRGMTRKVVE